MDKLVHSLKIPTIRASATRQFMQVWSPSGHDFICEQPHYEYMTMGLYLTALYVVFASKPDHEAVESHNTWLYIWV